MSHHLDPQRDEKIRRKIRENYSLEEEVRLLRRMTAYLFQHVTHTMSEYELKRMQSHPDALEFWQWFEHVENTLRANPGKEAEQKEMDEMNKVHQDIANTLTDSEKK